MATSPTGSVLSKRLSSRWQAKLIISSARSWMASPTEGFFYQRDKSENNKFDGIVSSPSTKNASKSECIVFFSLKRQVRLFVSSLYGQAMSRSSPSGWVVKYIVVQVDQFFTVSLNRKSNRSKPHAYNSAFKQLTFIIRNTLNIIALQL